MIGWQKIIILTIAIIVVYRYIRLYMIFVCLVLRDNYDKEVKAAKQSHRGRFNPFQKAKKPDAAVYVPPSRKATTEHEEQQSSGKMFVN